MYAIVVGTSKYSSPAISLTYPDIDAVAMANAVQQTAELVFTKERTHVCLLATNTTNPDSIPSKENIKAAFNTIAAQAKPEDVILVYLSGHGTTYDDAGKSQFYYLTKDMLDQVVSDPVIREKNTISTEDLSGWLSKVPALKRVMIIDACNSGKIADGFTNGKAVDPSQVVALDQMKDRTGMFILAGSASNQKSFEANTYGHGLLTYALLDAMRGKALGPRGLVDVMTMFQYARTEVPGMARSLKGIQDPVPVFPLNGSSFAIGISDSRVDIELGTPKPVFVKSVFQDSTMFFDVLGLGSALDKQFELLTVNPAQSAFVFSPIDYIDNGYSVRGRYAVDGNTVRVTGKQFKGKEFIGDFKAEGDVNNMKGLLKAILNQLEPFKK
ncbi:MAG: caspase family protein [Lewinellaceae bacterium]|nr:caspase family protein [Lewinellaceae bacterium]